MRKYIAIITGQCHSTGILFAVALNALLAGVNGKILKDHFIISGKLSALKNVPHKKDIGTKKHQQKKHNIDHWYYHYLRLFKASAITQFH
jgi:hypothetical protein